MYSKFALKTHINHKNLRKKVIVMLFKATEHHGNLEISQPFDSVSKKLDFVQITLLRRKCSKNRSKTQWNHTK